MGQVTTESRPFLIPSLVVAAMQLAALGDWPYGYYMLLRLVTCGVAVFIALNIEALKGKTWVVAFWIIAAVFNPLIPIHLTRDIWRGIDIVTAVLFITAAFWRISSDNQSASAFSHSLPTKSDSDV